MNHRRVIKNPVLPGEMLSEEFLKLLKLTQKAFADHIGVDIKTVNRLIRGAHGRHARSRIEVCSNLFYKRGVLAEPSARSRYLESASAI